MKIAAVIVTYNRLNLLKEVLCAFDKQTRKPEYIIVVDNASTDGTEQYLNVLKMNDNENRYIIIRNEFNLGGSGGFYIGTQAAMKLDVDWIWVSDDDAIPDLDVFEKVENHIQETENTNEIAAICTMVRTSTRIQTEHRRCVKYSKFNFQLIDVPETDYQKKQFELDSFSYVGGIMNVSILRKSGLINKDYFIWYDDTEHCMRLKKYGKIICFPDMKVLHKINESDYTGLSWKDYYGYRNFLLMLKTHMPKRYMYTKAIRILAKSILSMNLIKIKLVKKSIKSGFKGETGIDSYYKPGWSPLKER